jgi:hypothetical protein
VKNWKIWRFEEFSGFMAPQLILSTVSWLNLIDVSCCGAMEPENPLKTQNLPDFYA